MKKIYIIIVGILVIAGAALAVRFLSGPEDSWICQGNTWIKHGNPNSPMPISGCGRQNQAIETQFQETGYLVKDNPGFKPNVWYLIYETAGSPALTQELNFDDEQGMPGLIVGNRVTIDGVLNTDTNVVNVTNIGTAEAPQEVRTVQLYYYNQKLDKEGCNSDYVLPVERQIPLTNTPIQDTIKLLIKGEITDTERSQGFTSEFPHAGFVLNGANLVNGILTLDFPEVNGFTVGGSCRVGILSSQITKTAKQFAEVKQVIYTHPDGMWQP
jgi:hypothetical protein